MRSSARRAAIRCGGRRRAMTEQAEAGALLAHPREDAADRLRLRRPARGEKLLELVDEEQEAVLLAEAPPDTAHELVRILEHALREGLFVEPDPGRKLLAEGRH